MTIKSGEVQSTDKLPPQRAAIEVAGVPKGWQWALKGGGKEVAAAIVSPDSTERLTLELTPPKDASTEDEHAIEVRARTASETVTLPLVVRLSAHIDRAMAMRR